MKAAQLTGIRKLEIVDLPEPELSDPEWVKLRVDRVGVCGSDVHYFRNGRIGDQIVSFPTSVGHECAGTIVEIGANVRQLKPGDRVAVDPAFSCGSCDQCQSGRENTCRQLKFMACPGEAEGAVAEYYVLPARNCLPIPETVSLDAATLAEPLSIGLHAARMGDVFPMSRVGILGAGPIGLSVLACAKAIAPATVYVTDLIDARLDVAKTLGADWVGNPNDQDVVAQIAEREPLGLDMVFECSGDPACIDQAVELLMPGGTLLMVGIPAVPRVEFDVHAARRHELTFRSVRRQRGCVAPVLRMIAQGHIAVEPFLTHRFELDRIADAFELVDEYRDGVIKALIDLTSAK